MRKRIIRPERRRIDKRPRRSALGDAVQEGAWSDQRVHCWDLEPECTDERRKLCAAYFIRRNCWDIWAAEFFPAGRKPCCHSDLDCGDCPVAAGKFTDEISVYVEPPRRGPASRTTVAHCANLYTARDGYSGKSESDDRVEFRCRRRPGIMLHETYVMEVCSCLEHRECIFCEAE